MKVILMHILCHLFAIYAQNFSKLYGHVYGNYTINVGTKLVRNFKLAKNNRYLLQKKVVSKIQPVTDHNFRKQFARSKLARGSAVSKKCNSRCSVKIYCNKRCKLARDRYQLELAKKKYKKDHIKKYTTKQLNQRYYSGQVAKGLCNSRCQANKKNYQKERTQYMKIFHEPCQNGHIKNKDKYKGKPLSDQGNPSGDTPGDKTAIGGYGGVAKGRPLGRPGAGQINWPNSAKYNWRIDCRSYSKILGPPSKNK
jgi:hypothetical protein